MCWANFLRAGAASRQSATPNQNTVALPRPLVIDTMYLYLYLLSTASKLRWRDILLQARLWLVEQTLVVVPPEIYGSKCLEKMLWITDLQFLLTYG